MREETVGQLLEETVGELEDGSPVCLKCGRKFKKRHGAIQHVKFGRCPPTRAKISRSQQRRAQNKGFYTDPSLGRVDKLREANQLYVCQHCGSEFKRLDTLSRHVKSYCEAAKRAQGSPPTEKSSTIPTNEEPHSAAHSPMECDPIEAPCVANAG
jgi:predicted RNA-binding Zn-ribbon protein involved in translation (DUF1610 family)